MVHWPGIKVSLEQVPFPSLHKGAVGASGALAELSEAGSEVTEAPTWLQMHLTYSSLCIIESSLL